MIRAKTPLWRYESPALTAELRARGRKSYFTRDQIRCELKTCKGRVDEKSSSLKRGRDLNLCVTLCLAWIPERVSPTH